MLYKNVEKQNSTAAYRKSKAIPANKIRAGKKKKPIKEKRKFLFYCYILKYIFSYLYNFFYFSCFSQHFNFRIHYCLDFIYHLIKMTWPPYNSQELNWMCHRAL